MQYNIDTVDLDYWYLLLKYGIGWSLHLRKWGIEQMWDSMWNFISKLDVELLIMTLCDNVNWDY